MAEDNARINIKVDRNEKIAFKRAIAEAIRQGYLVVPATGRSFYRLREDVIGVDGIRYVISAGGGQLAVKFAVQVITAVQGVFHDKKNRRHQSASCCCIWLSYSAAMSASTAGRL